LRFAVHAYGAIKMETELATTKTTPAPTAPGEHFHIDIPAIRANARKDVLEGAHTSSYQGDIAEVVELLNHALATEIVCVLRYKMHHFTAVGLSSESIASEFAIHAQDEQEHADRIAARIVQLGGAPDFAPQGLAERSHSDYVACTSLDEMIRENLIAERIAIDTYREMIRYIGDKDPTTRRMLEDILAKEEEHAEELADWSKRQ
jgi:bacterioferritin